MQTDKLQRVFIIDNNINDACQQQSVAEEYCPSAIIHSCRSAKKALSYLRQYPSIPTDLILININEYEPSGKYFLAAAQQQAAACTFDPVVILTVSSSREVEVFRQHCGGAVSDYLRKPIVPEFFEYLMEFHFDREGSNSVISPSADGR